VREAAFSLSLSLSSLCFCVWLPYLISPFTSMRWSQNRNLALKCRLYLLCFYRYDCWLLVYVYDMLPCTYIHVYICMHIATFMRLSSGT
jgi:hypothetical protein